MRGLWWIPYLGLTPTSLYTSLPISLRRLRLHALDLAHRPNGPGDPSPGLRPKADALGNEGNKTPILAA